ncbi:hypothetical protein L596_007342 [Steinernema carpocapsae]|uniref:Uncharacterized protein n=1 Tax=Steinernema carpocapsae TaxID=34508 RepID=A0A4U5P944_STECR|nr:hypothetical protein L596_007342 [Steinernema carpocapsae]
MGSVRLGRPSLRFNFQLLGRRDRRIANCVNRQRESEAPPPARPARFRTPANRSSETALAARSATFSFAALSSLELSVLKPTAAPRFTSASAPLILGSLSVPRPPDPQSGHFSSSARPNVSVIDLVFSVSANDWRPSVGPTSKKTRSTSLSREKSKNERFEGRPLRFQCSLVMNHPPGSPSSLYLSLSRSAPLNDLKTAIRIR